MSRTRGIHYFYRQSVCWRVGLVRIARAAGLLTLVAFAVACSTPTPTPAPTASAPTPSGTITTAVPPKSTAVPSPTQVTEIKWAGYQPVTHFVTKITQETINDIEARSKGQIKVSFFPAEQLLPTKELFSAVADGRVQMVSSSTGYEEGEIPQVKLLSIFGLWKNYEHVAAAFGPLQETLQPYFAAKGVYMAGLSPTTFWNIIHRSVDPSDPANLKGSKMRVNSQVWVPLMDKVGASSVFIATGELYTGLQRGTVDGAGFLYSSIRTYKLNEVAKYVALVPALGLTNNSIYANLNWFNNLPKEKRDIIDSAIRTVFNARVHQAWRDQEQAEIAELRKSMTVRDLTPEQAAKWQEVAFPVGQQVVKDIGPDGQRLWDLAMKYAK